MNRMCKICETKKLIDEFPTYLSKGKFYHMYECNSCHNPSKRYQDNKEKILERTRIKRKENPAKCMWVSARARAKRQSIIFTIKESDIIIPSVCPILGIPMKINTTRVDRRNSFSLDRIDPTKGYTPDNIQVISNFANTMKNDATPDELIAFAKWVLATYP